MLLKAVIDGDAARHTSRKRRGVMIDVRYFFWPKLMSDEVNRPSFARRPLSLSHSNSKQKIDSHHGDERLVHHSRVQTSRPPPIN